MKSDRLYCQREVGHGVSRDWIKINVQFVVTYEMFFIIEVAKEERGGYRPGVCRQIRLEDCSVAKCFCIWERRDSSVDVVSYVGNNFQYIGSLWNAQRTMEKSQADPKGTLTVNGHVMSVVLLYAYFYILTTKRMTMMPECFLGFMSMICRREPQWHNAVCLQPG
jgi:hypothetical protein